MTRSVVEIQVGDFKGTLEAITLTQEACVDLPVPVSWSIRIIRTKGRATLGKSEFSEYGKYYRES